MGMLTPLYSLMALLMVPIIALYFMKPKSEKKVIASHFLWKKTIDSVNLQHLDKRLIRNWLFYLQLAIICLGSLFLMQPYINKNMVESKEVVLIVDATATMATYAGEETRLDQSKKAAKELVESLKGGSNITVYALEDTLTLLYKGSSQIKAKEAIEAIDQRQVPVSPKALELLLQSYGDAVAASQMMVFSDRVLSENTNLQHYLSTGGANKISIEKVNHRRGEDKDFLQVMIQNKQSTPVAGELAIYGNEELLSLAPMIIGSDSQEAVAVEFDAFYDAYKVEWVGEDDYLLDNVYYHAVGVTSTKKILLAGEDNRFLEEALMILPNVEVYRTELSEAIEGYDLYVYNGTLPERLPDKGSLLLINPKTSRAYLKMGKTYTQGAIEFLREDALWRHVKLDFNVREVQTIETVIGAGIMQIDDAPIIAKGQVEGHPAVVVGFDLLASDFPIRIGFPVFMHNSANYLLGQLNRVQSNSEIGSTVTFYGDPRANKRTLEGMTESFELKDSAILTLSPSDSGFYILSEMDSQEVVKKSVLGFNVSRDQNWQALEADVATELSVLTVDTVGHQSFKWVILLLLVALIFIEWWVYNHGY